MRQSISQSIDRLRVVNERSVLSYMTVRTINYRLPVSLRSQVEWSTLKATTQKLQTRLEYRFSTLSKTSQKEDFHQRRRPIRPARSSRDPILLHKISPTLELVLSIFPLILHKHVLASILSARCQWRRQRLDSRNSL
jgi:hypothetical protein